MLYKVTGLLLLDATCQGRAPVCGAVSSRFCDQLLRLGTFVWNGCIFSQLSIDFCSLPFFLPPTQLWEGSTWLCILLSRLKNDSVGTQTRPPGTLGRWK